MKKIITLIIVMSLFWSEIGLVQIKTEDGWKTISEIEMHRTQTHYETITWGEWSSIIVCPY